MYYVLCLFLNELSFAAYYIVKKLGLKQHIIIISQFVLNRNVGLQIQTLTDYNQGILCLQLSQNLPGEGFTTPINKNQAHVVLDNIQFFMGCWTECLTSLLGMEVFSIKSCKLTKQHGTSANKT